MKTDVSRLWGARGAYAGAGCVNTARRMKVAAMLASAILTLHSLPAWSDVASVKAEFYSEPGSHSQWRQQVSTVDERVDPFNGSLQLSYVDLVVPGAGGLDIRIQRHYSSNIWLSRPNPFSTPPYPTVPLPEGPAGLGWTIDLGRVVRSERDPSKGPDLGICATYASDTAHDTTEDAVLELPDGSQHVLTVSATGASLFITRSNWLANCYGTSQGLILYAPNGLKYTMDYLVAASDEVTYTTRLTRAWYPTKIEDSNGNYLTITYQGQKGSHALIKQIVASDGRVVDFTYYPDNYLQSITANGQTWTYEYDVPADITGHKLLKRVTRPDSLTWEYQYYPAANTAGRLALQTATYPYGATVSYAYDYVDFVGNVAIIGGDPSNKYYSVAVVSKTQGGSGVTPGTWLYSYQPGTESTIEPGLYNDQTTVTFPGGKYVYKHYGMQRQLGISSQVAPRELWKTGLLKEKETYTQTAGGYVMVDKEIYTWQAPTVISFEKDPSLPYDYFDFNVFYPQLASKTVIRDGTTYTTQYSYERTVNNQTVIYPRPQFKDETGQVGEANQITRHTELIWFPADPARVWLFDQVVHEIVENNDAFSILREFDNNNYSNANLTAYQPYGVVERYTYYPTGDMQTKTNARGFIWQYNNYYRGVPGQEIQPVSSTEQITIDRIVNDTGTIASETNGRRFTTNYQYDGLNRPTLIDLPLGADTGVQWTATGRIVTRGTNQQTKLFDGFGRHICVDVQDTASGAHVTKVIGYNALGYKSFESYPFQGTCSATTSPAGDVITTDVLGRVTRIDHPDGTFATNEYLPDNTVRTTNERAQVTTYIYRSFGDPDKSDEKALMRIDAPENVSTVFTRNIIGQAQTVTQGTRSGTGQITNGVTRSYTYDPNNNFLLTASNPETGDTVYTRDAVGNMKTRAVGSSGTATYYYDRLNRLTNVDYPSPTADATFKYDANSNLSEADTDTGFIGTIDTRTLHAYHYDANDNLQNESVEVGILQNQGTNGIVVIEDRTLTAQYGYDQLDHLSAVTYPSTQIVNYAPDAFGRPTQVGPYVNGISYFPSGQPSSITYANGKRTDYTLNNRQWIQHITTSGSAVDLTYDYDGRGNVRTITDGIDSQKNRSMVYDGVDRLITANGTWGTGSIGYDAVGNIRTNNVGGVNLTYGYDANNRLSTITGTKSYSFSYDVYGNVSGNGRNTFRYDDAGNLASVSGGTNISYLYDANSMRIRSTKDAAYYLYSKNGDLLGEYSIGDPATYKEYAYLGGKLVAQHAVGTNQSPVANAGTDQTVAKGSAVTLDGSASTDPDGTIAGYQWSQISGPVVTLNGANTVKPTFTAPQVTADTVLTFALTVVDNLGFTGSANVNVTVYDSDTDNDGLLDAWEMQYFGSLNQGPNDDPDGDGLTNLQEFMEKTDPTVTNPAPTVVNGTLARAGNAQNGITWTGVIGAARYNLYWSLSPGVTKSTGTKISGVTTPYIHGGLVNGTRYYYVVTAENAVGESAESSEASAVPGINQWGAPTTLSASARTYRPQMNASGQAVAVWSQWNNSTFEAWAERYDPQTGWLPPEKVVDSIDLNDVLDIAMDKHGNATTVWASNTLIYASRFTPSDGWSAPALVSTDVSSRRSDFSSRDKYVAMDGNGNVMVAWPENALATSGTGFTSYLKVSRYDALSAAWNAPLTLETLSNGWVEDVHIAMSDTGNAIAVWRRFYVGSDGNLYSFISARQYNAATNTWGATLQMDIGGDTPGVAMNPSGDAMVTWTAGGDGVWARHYDAVTGWDAPMRVGVLVGPESGAVAEVGMDSSGNAVAVWNPSDGNAHSLIYASRYDGTAGLWSAPVIVGDRGNDFGMFNQPFFAMDDSGNAVVLWLQQEDQTANYSSSVWANWYTANGSWQGAYPVRRCIDPTTCNYAAVAVGGNHDALALWEEADDVTRKLQAGHFDFVGIGYPSPNLPPIAYAGLEQQTFVEGMAGSLNGSGSSDPDGNIASYSWTQTYGPVLMLNGANTANPTFIAPQVSQDSWAGFLLQVIDNAGASSWDFVDVIVTDSSNSPPTADAGMDQTVNEGSTVTLSGSGTDTDGTIASYQWSQTAGPAVTLTNADSATATFTAPRVTGDTVLSFMLVVTDNGGASGVASVNVTVRILDADGDGLPDLWEQQYFGNLDQTPTGDADGDGISNQQEFLNGTDPTIAAPPAVSGVMALRGDGQNTLSWSPSANATSYNLYWSTTPGVTTANGNKIAGVTSPYNHAGLANGTAYYYIVTALNVGGESTPSAEVTATPSAIAPDGDLNGDGVVDVADVLLAEGFALGLTTPTANQLLHADVAPAGSPDGVIDAADVDRIRRKALGLENF